MTKIRADLMLVEQNLAPSRAKAQALILAGIVRSGDKPIRKAGELLEAGEKLALTEPPRLYVSRGGEKLAHALDAFAVCGLSVQGAVAVDIGASTGGFTDCLLKRAAARVYAVDVGYGQLAYELRCDPRVVVRERTNARSLTSADFPEPITLAVVDASFIGLAKLMGAITQILAPKGSLVALVKPQFEAGRQAASRGRGVIRDPDVREQAIATARGAVESAGFAIVAESDSALPGPKGNVERFVYATRGA